MSLSVQVGLLLAAATALTSIVGFLYKHRGAVQAPAVDFRRPLWSSLVLFRSGWYVLGIVVSSTWGRSRLPRYRWCRRSSPAASSC